MQEEVNEKTVALIIRSSKVTAEALKAALVKVMRDMEKANQKRAAQKEQKKAQAQECSYQGRTSLKEMMKEGSQLTNIEITDQNIKSFEKIARKYGIEYSLKKDTAGEKPRYLVFFRARDADVMTAAFKEYTGATLTKTKKPSIRKKLQKAIDRAAKHRERDKTKKREQEQSLPAFSLLAMVCLLEWIWGGDCSCHGYTAIRSLDSITTDELLNATSMAIEMKQKGVLGKPCPDYVDETVSMKVVRIIQGYVGVVNKMVWRKY